MIKRLLGGMAWALALASGAMAAPVTLCDLQGQNCVAIQSGGLTTTPAAPSYPILPAGQTSGSAIAPQAGGYGIALPGTTAAFAGATITITDTANNGVARSTTYTAPQSVPPVLCPSAGDVITATSTNGSQTQAIMLNANPGASCPNITVGVTTSTSTNPVVSFQQTATTSAAAMPANILANGLIFNVWASNSGRICVGGPTVTLTTGFCMAPGQTVGITAGSLGVANTNQIYMIGSNTTDVLQALGN